MLIKKLIYDFEKMGKGIIWIRIKAKTIPIKFNKVSFKLEFVKIVIANCYFCLFTILDGFSEKSKGSIKN